ncbi:MAG: histidinol dehydrogenase [Hyphomicrobiales bacterium]
MPIRLDARSADFAVHFRTFLDAKREASADVEQAVRAIIADVAARGDAALLELTEKFDRVDLAAIGMRVTPAEFDAAAGACDPAALDALTLARDRIETYHRRQLPKNDRWTDPLGVELGHRWTAIEAVGLYVPGGTAAYPSSVLMNAVPAKVAGCPRVVMVVPAPDGKLNPLVLAAAKLAGVDEIYRIGGAQAVAALAYGTATIAPVAKIVGPGNAYVAAAKRLVFGRVGIDMIAGPSEVLIIADGAANPEWIAADLLAQAEHDMAAQSILITDDATLAGAVERAVEGQLKTLPRGSVAAASWRDFGAIIMVGSLDDAVPLTDAIAPEHLEIETHDAERLSEKIRNTGAIFLGSHTPEAIGDYVAGSNHVLPTARSARFSSGLGVLDFMKRTSILRLDADALRKLGPAAIALGEAEGLDAHARSVAMRLNPR